MSRFPSCSWAEKMQGEALPLEASLLRSMETLAHRANFSPNARNQWFRSPLPPIHLMYTGEVLSPGDSQVKPAPFLPASEHCRPSLPSLYHPSTCAPSSLGALPTWVCLCPQQRRPARRMGGRASWDIAAGSEVSGLFSIKFSKWLLLSHKKTIDF